MIVGRAFMLWHAYLRNQTTYIPTVAQTEAGFFLDIEPVELAPATDEEAPQQAIMRAIRRGNPRVPTPTRAEFPKPVVLKHANVKSWSAFERGCLSWTISEEDGQFKIARNRRRPDRGWEEDHAALESFPPGTSVHEIARQRATLIGSEVMG